MNKVLIIIVLIFSLIALNNNDIPKLFKKNKELLQGALSAGLVTIFLYKPLIENLPQGEGTYSCSEAESKTCSGGLIFDNTLSYETEPEKECCGEAEPSGGDVYPDGSCITWVKDNPSGCSNGNEPEPGSDDKYEPGSEPEDVCCHLVPDGSCITWLKINPSGCGEAEPSGEDKYEPGSEPEDVCCSSSLPWAWIGLGVAAVGAFGLWFNRSKTKQRKARAKSALVAAGKPAEQPNPSFNFTF
tara:strand:+ start:99 stop:827 length:729 start_codon:yes stop_codon:yes gene_type:complete